MTHIIFTAVKGKLTERQIGIIKKAKRELKSCKSVYSPVGFITNTKETR
jgi:hypothetical protein